MAVSQVSRPFQFEPQPPKIPQPLNIKSIAESLKGILTDNLVKLLPDVEADLQKVASDIAPVLVSAALSGDKALKDELVAQLEAIAEINSIRAGTAARETFKQVAGLVLSVLSVGISVAVKAATGGVV